MTAAPPEIVTRSAVHADLPAISQLSERVFGPGRFARSAYRVREGTPPVSPFCRVALDGDKVIAAIRMTDIEIGGEGGALLLGPLAVEPANAGQGYARRLIRESIEAARAAGRRLVVLVGDMAYYGRLGFVPVPPGQIAMPGPADPARILAFEIVPGSLADFKGMVSGLAST